MQTAKNILDRIKEVYVFDKDNKLAEFLEVSPATLSTWKSRDTIDYKLIFAKCKDINLHWLLTGEGKMSLKHQDPEMEKIIMILEDKPDLKRVVLKLIE